MGLSESCSIGILHCIYKLGVDQGSIVAGGLALLAGIGAYKAAVRQAKATEEQSAYYREQDASNRRRQVRQAAGEAIATAEILNGHLMDVSEWIKQVEKQLDLASAQPGFRPEQPINPAVLPLEPTTATTAGQIASVGGGFYNEWLTLIKMQTSLMPITREAQIWRADVQSIKNQVSQLQLMLEIYSSRMHETLMKNVDGAG